MDQFNVDQNQFMKQVRERAEVLSKNARQNPDEVAEKVSKYDEEDEEMKDYLQVIRGTEKKDSGPTETPRKIENDDLDLDFASHLASSVQLDFSKERFKADLAQRRVQKRRRPQSWAWAATTENDSVKLRQNQESSNSTLNVSIEVDEATQPEEVPRKTVRPPNRFSSPIFNEKLMSDLGSALNKKKSPLGKPVPPIPSKSPNKNDSESMASQPLKSTSPVSSPRSVSPLVPRSESPVLQKNLQQTAKTGRSPSPNLVLVTEKDLFGVKVSPVLQRRLQEDNMQHLPPDPTFLQSNKNEGKIENETKDKGIPNVDKAAENANRKPPPPKPKVKPKAGQSSAMLLKNAAEQSKVDVAKEEEKRVVKAKPNWLEELQKKKIKQEKGRPTQKLNDNWISSDPRPLQTTDEAKEEPLTKEETLAKVESPTDAMPAWMKLEFFKLKHRTDTSESEESNPLLEKGRERDIDSLLGKPKVTATSKPSWLEELNTRKQKQTLVSDTILKENEKFDYRSHENTKQKTEESDIDKESNVGGTVNSVSDIKERLSKSTGNEQESLIKKPVPLKKSKDESKKNETTGLEPTGKQEILTGDSKQNIGHSEQKEGDYESKSFIMETSSISGKVEGNGKDEIDGISVENKNDKMALKGADTFMSGSENTNPANNLSHENKNKLKTEKSKDGGNGFEVCLLENSYNKNNAAEENPQDSVIDFAKEDASRIESNKTTFVCSNNDEERSINILDESRNDSYQNVGANRMDTEIVKGEADNSKIVEKELALDYGQVEKGEKKIDGVFLSGTTIGDHEKPDDNIYKLSSDSKAIDDVEPVDLSGSIERSSAVLSNKVVDTSVVGMYPDSHTENERSKDEEKEEERKMFPKPLRRKLVRINSFEQGALSKPASNDGQKKPVTEACEQKESHSEPKSTVNIEETEDYKSKVYFSNQKFENRDIPVADTKDQSISKIDSENLQPGKGANTHVVDMDIKTKAVDGEDYGKDMGEAKATFVSLEKGHGGKEIAPETSNDKMNNSSIIKEDDSINLKGTTDISKTISNLANETHTKDKELFEVNKENVYNNRDLDNSKKDVLDSKKKISSLEEENKSLPSKKKPPAPKPKPKPKVPLKPAKEMASRQQQDELKKETFIKVDAGHEVEPKKIEVTQRENLKNIQKSRNSIDSGSSKEELNERIQEQHEKPVEREADKKVNLRTKNEYKSRQSRPVSMFESFTAFDGNMPVRERKFSGIGSGTKFAAELDRKQKTCWFRGALDTSDIKAIDAYDGSDDIPAWKRQLLAKLKSNESSSAKKLERGQAMDHQQRDEFSHFRNRTVTSPDGLSSHKKTFQLPAKKSQIIEEANGESTTTENEEEERPVPAFLLEFASKKQLKVHRETAPKVMQNKEPQRNSRTEEFV